MRTREPLTWENALWADGPLVYRFLAERGVIARLSAAGTEMWGCDPDALAMRELIYKWKHGSRATVAKVDAVLVRFDMHLSELPDDVWCRRGRSAG